MEQKILTGIRPTGQLTIANYIGAIKDAVRLQNEGKNVFLFVADIHALTDEKKPDANLPETRIKMVKAFMALGIDPSRTTIYFQSDIAYQVSLLTLILSRYATVAELLRVPTLKEKIGVDKRVENASAMLSLYPILMAADILIQRATDVPVGSDQLPHIELTRRIARKFNEDVGEAILPICEAVSVKSLKILSLKDGEKGLDKMSKSNPNGAIFLDESKDVLYKKIKTAQTSMEGKITPHLESMITIIEEIAGEGQELVHMESLIKRHVQGEPVLSEIKKHLYNVVVPFIDVYQNNRDNIHDIEVIEVIEVAKQKVTSGANETISMVRNKMFI